jgi:hypothetical protein
MIDKYEEYVKRYSLHVWQANHEGVVEMLSPDANPRVDRVVALPPHLVVAFAAKLCGREARPRVKVLAGTPTPGADLQNLAGAPQVPQDARLLGDVVVPRRIY